MQRDPVSCLSDGVIVDILTLEKLANDDGPPGYHVASVATTATAATATDGNGQPASHGVQRSAHHAQTIARLWTASARLGDAESAAEPDDPGYIVWAAAAAGPGHGRSCGGRATSHGPRTGTVTTAAATIHQFHDRPAANA